eukprot:m.260420 g.260420  ORF g.260420 m.260420 type:complete len:356 (+) comp22739_c9_seq2:273-1340(+)
MRKTLLAAVKLRATPPALREIKNTEIWGVVLKASMTLARWVADMRPSSLMHRMPERCSRHSSRSRNLVNWENTILFTVWSLFCRMNNSSSKASILVELRHSSAPMRLTKLRLRAFAPSFSLGRQAGLRQINGQRAKAHGARSGRHVARVEVHADVFAAKHVFACTDNCILCLLMADAADINVRAGACLVGHKPRMTHSLTHAHQQVENMGIVIQHSALPHIGHKLCFRFGVQTLVKVLLLLIQQVAAGEHHAWRKAQLTSALDLGAPQHQSEKQFSQVVKGQRPWPKRSVFDNGVENFTIPPAKMAHAAMTAFVTHATGKLPLQALALTLPAKVVAVRICFEHFHERIKLPYAVL